MNLERTIELLFVWFLARSERCSTSPKEHFTIEDLQICRSAFPKCSESVDWRIMGIRCYKVFSQVIILLADLHYRRLGKTNCTLLYILYCWNSLHDRKKKLQEATLNLLQAIAGYQYSCMCKYAMSACLRML